MDDRTMLEMAARAIGYTILDWYGERFTAHDGEKLAGWNPLVDDGDAFRLATQLEMEVILGNGEVIAGKARNRRVEQYGCDRCAATRRAIVRAAAALAQEMK